MEESPRENPIIDETAIILILKKENYLEGFTNWGIVNVPKPLTYNNETALIEMLIDDGRLTLAIIKEKGLRLSPEQLKNSDLTEPEKAHLKEIGIIKEEALPEGCSQVDVALVSQALKRQGLTCSPDPDSDSEEEN